MTPTRTFYAVKGGQGTTTTAAMTALACARQGKRTLLVDAAADHDVLSVLGQAPHDNLLDVTRPLPNLAVFTAGHAADLHRIVTDEYDAIIIDNGTRAPEVVAGERLPIYGQVTLVTRACYLALRAAAHRHNADTCVLVKEPGRALGELDVEHVLGIPVVTVAYDISVARAVDCGLLTARVDGDQLALDLEVAS